jgi:polyphosphate kinase 2
MKSNNVFSNNVLGQIHNKEELLSFLKEKKFDLGKVSDVVSYIETLHHLQIELLKLQNWILKHQKRVVIIFEGRDAAGKGGAIRRFIRYLNPRSVRVVALNKPTDIERGQWYFRRHVKELPNSGEMVFFDRSWYNRAVIEPVMGFCTPEEYEEFIRQVPEFEHMLFENGVEIVKFWFSITKKEQTKRLKARETDPLKQWKLSQLDEKSNKKWDEITYYKEEMFSKTHTGFAPWIIIRSDTKRTARLESIRYVLSKFEYDGKADSKTILLPDPNIVYRFHRSLLRKGQHE